MNTFVNYLCFEAFCRPPEANVNMRNFAKYMYQKKRHIHICNIPAILFHKLKSKYLMDLKLSQIYNLEYIKIYELVFNNSIHVLYERTSVLCLLSIF